MVPNNYGLFRLVIGDRSAHISAQAWSGYYAIFSAQESPELFSPLNCLLISKAAEEKIGKGLILIVPDVDHASDWEAISPPYYLGGVRCVEVTVSQQSSPMS